MLLVIRVWDKMDMLPLCLFCCIEIRVFEKLNQIHFLRQIIWTNKVKRVYFPVKQNITNSYVAK